MELHESNFCKIMKMLFLQMSVLIVRD